MRHPQDDLLIVYALAELARRHRYTQIECMVITLADEIASEHGLTVLDKKRQFEIDCG